MIKKKFGFYLEHVNSYQNRFYAIYFVDSLTGALLLSKRYTLGNISLAKTDDDLIGNFLNAINLFIKEIGNNKHEEIQEINFKDMRIIYEKKNRLICIAITEKSDINVERMILHEILEDFYNRFEREIKFFKGYITPEIMDYVKRLDNLPLNYFFKSDFKL